MIGLDTNVLLRNLAQDDPVQSPRATQIITRRLTGEEPGFVSLVTPHRGGLGLEELVQAFAPGNRKRHRDGAGGDFPVYHAVVALRNGTGSFEDALIGSLGIWRGCSVTLTFDEKAAQRLHGFGLA